MERLTSGQMDDLLNKKSGLKGLSGISNDMRDILKAMKEGHRLAKKAFEVFVYRIKKYIGAYIAILQEVDAIVFTAGIGENVKSVRDNVIGGLTSIISKRTKILIIPTDEELLIAQDTFNIVKRLKREF